METRNPRSATRNPRRPRPGRLAAGSLLTAALALGGCIPSYPLAQGELDRYWMLTDVAAGPAGAATRPAEPAGRAPGGFQFPARWVIRQQPSLIWSTVSIVRAMDKLKAGTSEVEFSVSPSHARALVNLLGQVRAALADLRAMLESTARADQDRWARTLAAALVKMESITRLVTAEEPPAGAAPPADAGMGIAGQPMMSLIAKYLDEQSGGGLLDDLSPGELKHLRDVLTETVVRLGFEVAGKEPTPAVRKQIVRQMRSAPRMDELDKALAGLLAEQIAQAAPARGGGEKRKAVLAALRWAPKGVKLLESFLSQWDRMDGITVELLKRGGESAVSVTLATLPGKEVRIDDVMTGLPAIVFRGATRIVIQGDATPAGETVVSFEPIGDGAVELRYEGLVYGLVRLFALPLDSGPIREVRVSGGASGDRQLVNVAVLTESSGDRADPRRMIVVQDSRTLTILRRAFSVRAVATRSETVVSYITPARRYTYQRIKGSPAP